MQPAGTATMPDSQKQHDSDSTSDELPVPELSESPTHTEEPSELEQSIEKAKQIR